MHSSPPVTVTSVLVSGIKDMRIPTQVLIPGQSLKAIDTRALVDSGADLSCIDWDFVKKHKIPRTKLANPIPINNVDESANKTGVIRYTCTIFLHIKGVTMEETLHVLHCRNENVILGRPWLKKTNPKSTGQPTPWKSKKLSTNTHSLIRNYERTMRYGKTHSGNHPQQR